MNKRFKVYCVALLSVALMPTITETTFAQEKKWEDSAELSYVQTGGNTDIMTFSGKNELVYHLSEKWEASWKAGVLYGETDGVASAERYNTDLRTDYNASDILYFYASGGWLKDTFAGIDSRIYLGPGAGYKILTGERHFLSVEGGLNYARETYTDDTDESFMEGRLLGEYELVFNAKTKISQTAEYLHNFDETDRFRINTVTALTTALSDIFSLKVSYEINFQNEPTPETLDQTDTIFSVALMMSL